MKLQPKLLLIIIIIAAFLRFFQLGINPPSLTWDEVAWGYNAYSLGIDGKDEFGRYLPITYLESFGDFKPPVYAYLDIIPVKLFGLSELAVRFPSAFFGVLTVLMTYFLVKAIFVNSGANKTKTQNYVDALALSASLILAVSPWHIMLSRAAFEANIATFFLVTGVTCFLYWLKSNRIFLILSASSFGLSLYTFNSARVVGPLLVLMLAISFWKKLWQKKIDILIAGIIGFLIVAPLIPFLLTSQAKLRYQEVNIFSDPGVVKMANQEIGNDNNSPWSKIIHNRRILYAGSFISHYLDHFSPNYLFIKGDVNPKFSTQDTGQLYLWSLPFIIFGAFYIFKKREGYWWLIPVWLLLSIIPAAAARETPHALRTEAALPTYQILEAYGFINILFLIKERFKKNIFKIACVICGVFYFVNVLYFIHGYYSHYAWQYSGEWQYGYKDSIAYVKAHEQQYDKVVVSDFLGRPYIYYLFYLDIPPSDYRKEAVISRDVFGFVTVSGFGKFTFTDNINNIKPNGKKVLYINNSNNIPKSANVLKTFNQLNGSPVFTAYTLD